MRACYSGNRELALKLYNRCPKSVEIRNKDGEDCLQISKSQNFPEIATVLECLEAARILESKNASYLTITPQTEEFVRPFEVVTRKQKQKSPTPLEFQTQRLIFKVKKKYRKELMESEFIDVETLSDEDQSQSQKLTTDQRVLNLAEQFLKALPERIKNHDEIMQWEECSCNGSEDLGIESMTSEDFDQYREILTPNSVSPVSRYE